VSSLLRAEALTVGGAFRQIWWQGLAAAATWSAAAAVTVGVPDVVP